MSDEKNESNTEKPAEAAAPAAKPAEKKEPEPKKVDPGEFGALLIKQGISVEPLGNDAMGTEMLRVEAQDLLKAAEFLRDNAQCRFDFLVHVSGVDWKTHRESVAFLHSTEIAKRLVLKANADANDRIPSLMPVWPAADWHEREAYDLFGIQYEGHPDLRRILMPIDWVGYPLRKDYVENDPRLVWNRR